MNVHPRWIDRARWLEHALLAIGLTLAAWSVLTWIQLEYFKSLPVRSQVTGPTLPGDPGERQIDSDNPSVSTVVRGSWLARLEVPTIGLQATVLEGSDDWTLARGAGHIESTPMPGNDGNVGIAGHRDTTFRRLRNIKVGDRLIVKTSSKTLEYRVADTKIVGPRTFLFSIRRRSPH